jgi:hypothetical protein
VSAVPARTEKTLADRSVTTDGTTADRSKHGRFGPYSRAIDRGAIGALNGRSREGRFVRHYESMLVEHCGGNPSITQRALISRAARLALHLELMDERALAGKPFVEHDHNYCVSWSNSLARMLARLGFDAVKVPAPSLDDVRRRITT